MEHDLVQLRSSSNRKTPRGPAHGKQATRVTRMPGCDTRGTCKIRKKARFSVSGNWLSL